MSKAHDNSHDNSQDDSQDNVLDKNQTSDMTVDLEAVAPGDSRAEPSTSRSQGDTSIDVSNISDFDQTMDLSPSVSSVGSATLDLEDPNDQTMDLADPAPEYSDGTRMVSPSMTPFQGKVFGDTSRMRDDEAQSDAGVPEDGTKIIGPDPSGQDYTMDIDSVPSSGSSSSVAGASLAEDGTMLLSDSQQGSQAGSSSIAGKSSYDQTMDLSESAPDSKNVSDARSLVTGNRTGQSIRTGSPTNSKSLGDSKQYLQAERAKASDAIYERLTDRRISYTVDWNDDTADYQIKKKNDPKTGKFDLHVLGKGGMGLVYLATQNSVKRSVALKVIRKDKQNDTFIKQFFYEAEITAGLEHPNITPVYELGRTKEGVCFYSMKYIQGNPWEKKIRDNSIDENLEIFDKLCDAIAFAHSKGILHMDIKPDNVQLGEFGEVYAVDWGVASDLKRPDSIRCAGTWQWISPEVARGDKSKIGKGSDIYLLGGILFQIVTGHHPRLPKDSTEKMGQSALAKAAQNNLIQPTDCKDPMVAVALKALASEPKDRYAKVDDLQTAIYAIQKERANIKSSQELTQKAVVLGSEAIEQGDYDRFNRSLFGLKDAIELWEQNPEAAPELNKVRLAYGQCAFDKGDYDLTLQTLDRNEPQEEELYQKAELAQTAVKLRVKRFRLLRNAFIISLLLGSGIVGLLWQQAEAERKEAVKQTGIAKAKTVIAEEQTVIAEEQTGIANKQTGIAKEQTGIAEAKTKIANEQTEIAKKNEEEARMQKNKAELQLAKTQLTEITKQLGLARSRINESNPSGAFGLLTSIHVELERLKAQKQESRKTEKTEDPKAKSIDDRALITQLPNPDHWAKNRIMLLANTDLDGVDLKTQANFQSGSSAFALDSNHSGLLVANPTGEIYSVALDGTDPQKIWEVKNKEIWIDSKVKAVRRIVPSPDGTRIYLALDRDVEPVVFVDLQTGDLLPYDKEIPKTGGLLALSPIARHIATTQPNYLWFTKNQPDSKGNIVATNKQVVQIQWLSDELLLALIKNEGGYFLQLVAPFAGIDTDEKRSSSVEYIAPLKEEVVRFALLEEQMPECVTQFREKFLSKLNSQSKGQANSQQVELFSEILESLHFVFGQGDGELVQARLKRPASSKSTGTKLWEFVERFPLQKKHVHAIEEILVEENAPTASTTNSSNSRKMITRAAKEQSVQVWTLSDGFTNKSNDNSVGSQTQQISRISHLHALTAGPLKEDSEDKGIRFARFDHDGDVLMINSELIANRLNVAEQIERNRVVLENPFNAAEAFEESTAKWLFNSPTNQGILSIDGHGVAAIYEPRKNRQDKQVDFGQKVSSLKIRQFLSKESNTKELVNIKEVKNDFQYWGHSPFAKIEHVTFSPDGNTALSLATVDGKSSVYITARDTDSRPESLTFSEICLWDVKNRQWLDRIAFESQVKIDRLSPVDEHRFVFGNTETLMLVERDVSSRLSTEHASRAVHFCIKNPAHPYQAYFRVDGFEGVCWIGNIPADGIEDTSKPTWFDLESNRLVVIPRPVAGCWSNDGTRLYVLDTKGNISRYDFDPLAGVLSSSLTSNQLDRLKYNEKLKFINGLSIVSPQQIHMGIAKSNEGPDGWSDEVYIGAIRQLNDNAKAEWSANPIHAVFHRKDPPNWVLDAGFSENQQAFENRVDQLFQLIKTTEVIKNDGKQTEVGHEPKHVTSDAQGQVTILQYPGAVLFLSCQDGQVPSWYRIERDFSGIESFNLSPDAKTLATRDAKGWHFYRVNKQAENQRFELEPIPSPLPIDANVEHFAWDPEQESNPPENSMRFACILSDNSVLYVQNGVASDLGKICSMQTQGNEQTPVGEESKREDKSETKTLQQLQASDIKRIWFFQEILTDRSLDPPSKRTLRYLALQTTIDKSEKPGNVRFIKLPSTESIDVAQSEDSRKRFSNRCVDLDLGQAFTEIVPNEQGGIIATGDKDGTVAVYLVSPYWETANQVFDANSEADSAIESLNFAEQGDTLVVSNANNHLFGLRTKPTPSRSEKSATAQAVR
ncbi:MAG: protein kinase [Planctomycetota bacterium]|nr:protein kinase [Planctomycetota bacterium]